MTVHCTTSGSRMLTLALGAAAALLTALTIGAVVIISGFLDVSAAKPHPEGWARLLHFAFRRSTAAHASNEHVPADLDNPTRIAAGAAYYTRVCATCHGGPGLGQNPVVLSLEPKPQYLSGYLATERYSPEELFRIIKGGVKYTAMPAWPTQGRDDEIWNVVAFLRELPSMSAERFALYDSWRRLRHTVQASPEARRPTQQSLRPMRLRNDREAPRASFSFSYPNSGFGGPAAFGPASCFGCHGIDGRGGGAFPKLTGQPAEYLRRTLRAFANGSRRSAYMQLAASTLSDAEIDAIADHFANLPDRAVSERVQGDLVLGRRIALAPDRRSGRPACSSCHSESEATDGMYPSLAGQSEHYIANQLHIFSAGGRGGTGVLNPMDTISHDLTDTEINAVAAFYAAERSSKTLPALR